MLKVNNEITRKRCEICSKLTIKTPERCPRRSPVVLIVNYENISHLFLVFLLLTWTSKCQSGCQFWFDPSMGYFPAGTATLLTLSQRYCTVENESCADVSFWRCDNVAVRRCQYIDTTLLQRRRNIKYWISRSFYYVLFWFLSRHRNLRELQKC